MILRWQTFSDINCTNVFLGQSPKAIESKTKINKWGLIKLYKFVHNKGNHKQNEKKTRERKYLQMMGPTFQNIQSYNSTTKKQPNQNMGRRPRVKLLQRRNADSQ